MFGSWKVQQQQRGEAVLQLLPPHCLFPSVLVSSSHFCTLEFSASFAKEGLRLWNSGTDAQLPASGGGSKLRLRGVKS